MAEGNPEIGTITDEADLMDLIFEEPQANLDDPDQAAPDADAIDPPEGENVTQDEPDNPDEPAQPAEAQQFTVKIDGKDESVSLDELLNGYQRQSDYTRQTQEVSALRGQVEAGTEHLKALLQQWTIPQEAEPNWTELAQTMDPREFNAARAQWETDQARSNQARQLHAAIQQQESSVLLQREQAALLDRIPEWKDKEAARGELAAIVTTAGKFGFSEQEVGSVTDHRVILMARELSRMQGAQDALSKNKQTTPPARAATQGRARQDDTAERNKKLMDNLKRTGSDDAAIALILGG